MKNCFGTALVVGLVTAATLLQLNQIPVGNGPAGAFFMPDPGLEKIPTEIHKDRFAVAQLTIQPTTYETKQGHLTEDLGLSIEDFDSLEPAVYEEDYSYEYTLDDMFRDELELIPSGHYELLIDSGWSIQLTDMDLADEYGYDVPIAGITDYDQKTIYVANRESAIRRATVHEVGHALSYEYGRVDLSGDFVALYDLEKSQFHDLTSIGDGHEIESSTEYFASVYQNMVFDLEGTYDDIPYTVDFIYGLLW